MTRHINPNKPAPIHVLIPLLEDTSSVKRSFQLTLGVKRTAVPPLVYHFLSRPIFVNKTNVCCNFYYCHRLPFLLLKHPSDAAQQFLAIFYSYRCSLFIRSNDTYRNHIVRLAIMCQQGISMAGRFVGCFTAM